MARRPQLETLAEEKRRGSGRLEAHIGDRLKRALAVAAAERLEPLAALLIEALEAHPDVARALQAQGAGGDYAKSKEGG